MIEIVDRTLVTNVPTKDPWVLAVLQLITQQLQAPLAGASGEPRRDPAMRLQRAWATLTTPVADPAIQMLLQTVGPAVRAQRPYPEVVPGWARTATGPGAARLSMPLVTPFAAIGRSTPTWQTLSAVGLVGFDMAGPTTRLIDVYNTAMPWVPLRDPVDIWPTWTSLDQAGRLRVLADAYGPTQSQRLSLIHVGVLRADRSWLLMKGAAEHLGGGWGRMWAAGVSDLIRRRQLWLTANHCTFLAALS